MENYLKLLKSDAWNLSKNVMLSEHSHCRYVSDAIYKEWIPRDPHVYSRLRVCSEKISRIESNNFPVERALLSWKLLRIRSRTHLKLLLPILPLQETVQEEKSMRYIIQHYLGQNHISKPQVLCRIQLNKQLSAILKLFQLGLWCKYNTMLAFEKDVNMSHNINLNPRLASWTDVG